MSKTVKNVMVSDHLLIAAFDEQGQQIPELQIPLLTLWARHAESLGFNPNNVPVEIWSAGHHLKTIVKMEEDWRAVS